MPEDRVFIHQDLVYQAADILDCLQETTCTVEFDSVKRIINIYDIETGEVIESQPWEEE